MFLLGVREMLFFNNHNVSRVKKDTKSSVQKEDCTVCWMVLHANTQVLPLLAVF